MSTKDTNPKDSIGSLKVPFHLVPVNVIANCALALLEGACKYGAYNYRSAGVRASVYYSATLRHLGRWWNEFEDIDPESEGSLHHLDKAIASLAVIRDGMENGKFVDDRPPRFVGPNIASKNKQAKEVIEQFDPEDIVPPYTELNLYEDERNNS